MKTNEIAGMGNHNTALYWEYDTRTTRRWNLDPKPQISTIDYAVFANNPILRVDPLGDKEYKNYEAYKKDLGVNALARKDMGSDGNWLKDDAYKHYNGVFAKAAHVNIEKPNGASEYKTLRACLKFSDHTVNI